ncbi:gliding motility-associated C-terminal domain-containing protein [Flavobacterium sp. SORGH_AS_0622]|uniref:T9SS type B sorting domain-containing protein n=1 Tax=Flavobacterium sp. SORGH_AS_0622 TaxID=3041772 RepID=UPI002783FE7D|nr:gliding motility-associated C-terminal domain-containing protein [Flavobacterium sp. SORGH_AS_0622]MDQ1166649.1 gliding motility-associated-like protein [Flavobacterium sp. SORGH_AS_0622]
MKKIYSQYFAVFYFLLMLIIGITEANAQVIKPFKERTSSYSPTKTIYKIKGDFTMIGNTNLTMQNYDAGETNGPFPMVYVDKDNNNQTVNSSAATLDLLNDSGVKLTNCYNIVYAGLYWTGRVSDAAYSPNSFNVTKNGVTKTLDKRKILFKGPNDSTYDEFTATDIYFPTNADNNMFTAYAEVTDYVRTNGIGEYFAANIAATEGADGGAIGKYAGWGLVVVYENSNMKNRDITVFDGHAFVQNNITAEHSFPVSGFNSVTSGPVDVKLGVMAGEGDVNYEGDYFQIQKLNTNNYLSLSRTGNSANNFFNSSISTGGNNRNPNLVNNSGLDISMFKLPNSNKDIIGNNQTSTTFKYGSTVDTYTIFSIVMAIDAYVPEIEGVLTATTINGSSAGAGPYTVLPGQELGYKIQIKNRGSEAIQNSKIVIPIPYNATFVSGSLAKTVNFTPAPSPNLLTYEPTIGANGSIVWNIGTLPLPSDPNTVLAELTFQLKSTENCALLKNSNCSNVIQVNGSLSGQGVNSTVTVTDKPLILGYTTSGSCTGTTISAPLQTTIDSSNYTNVNCQATSPTISFTFCNNASSIPITDVTGSFPSGSTFYNAYPVVAGTTTQYTINNPFPATVGTSTYYAIPPGAAAGCYFQFTIKVESITTMPTVIDPVNYCIGDNALPLTAVPSKPEYTLYYYQTATSTGQQTLTPSTAVAGQFTYYVAEGKTNACIGPKKAIVVNINSKPTITITNPLPICAPAATVDLTAANITAGSTSGLTYTYWTDAAATLPYANFSTAVSGTYYIKGTNTSNCYDIKPVVITKSTVIVTELTASHTDVKCFNETTGSITVNNASGGVAPYSYSWKKNGSAYAGTSQTLNNLGFGVYEVTATDANGCQGTITISILQPNAPLALAVSSKTDVLCFGESTGSVTAGTITNAVGTLTYSWKNSANVEVGSTASVSNLPAGTYTLTVTDSCSSQSNSVTIDQPIAALTLGISSKTDVVCFGESTGSVTAGTITNAVGTVTYSWKNSANVEVGSTASVSNLPAGTYTLTVTDSCSSQSNTVTISQPQNALSAVKTQTDVTCGGGNNGSATVTVSGGTSGYTYTWNTTPVQTTASAIGLTAGNYSVVITDANGCQLSESFTIIDGDSVIPIINPLPQTTTIYCPAAPVFEQATASDTNGTISLLTYVDTITPGNCAGSYTTTRTWTAKDTCGNISLPVSQTIMVQDNTAPTWTIQAGTLDQTIECSDAAALTAAQALFPTASDTCDADVTNIVKVSGQFIASANCANAGTYTNTWTVKDDCGNTSDTFTQVITIQDTTAPIFTGTLPLDIEASCDAVPEPAEMHASDNCNGDLPIVFSETKSDIQNGCASNYTLTRTWKTSDCSGNTASYTQILTVRDKTAPTGTAPANVNNLASIDLIPVGSPTDIKDAADNCSPTVNITVADTSTECDGNVSIVTRTYTLTDCAGNITKLVQTFSVNCKVIKVIVANDDTAGPVAGVNHSTTNVLNVFSNDTLEGIPVTPTDVILTTVTPNNYLQLNPNGSVDVLPNAPAGTLTLVYQICEAGQTDNCDTATVTITIETPKMTVTATPICINDVPYIDYVVTPINFTPVNGLTIAWADSSNTIITTMTDLPLNGRVLWPGAVVDGTGKGIDWPGWIFENNTWIQGPDGFEKLRPAANLIISLNPTETITVNYPPADPYCTARPTFTINANDDNPAPITGPGAVTNIVNVLTNDTLNNNAANINDLTLTIVTPDPKGVLTLNPNGSVDVAANVPAGTYILTYQICEKADFGNCDTAIVTIIILDTPAPPTPVVANDDSYNNIGCNTFGLVGNVLSNDFKGLNPATLQLVNFTLINENNTKTDPNITIDASGNVTVSSLTPAGTYTYSYRICDKLSAENCDTAIVTITVVPNGITEIKSTACTDDSTLINLTTLLPEGSPTTGSWIDRNNTNSLQGSVFNPFGLALGNYSFEYIIADEKCPRSIVLDMEVNDDCKVLACGNVLPHNAFSPNGDGTNDIFKIDNIEDLTCYPENTVEIYNRWGILVFETKNYNNTTNAFDGNSRGRTTVKQSDGLPTGTYFYIINYKSVDGNNTIQDNKLDGYLYLSK